MSLLLTPPSTAPMANMHFLLLLFNLHLFLVASSGDRDVLFKLKSAMLAPGGSGLDDWLPTALSHCAFSGVTCEPRDRVVALNASHLPLGGYLPPEIGLLTELVNLTVANSGLISPLPREIANLTRLRVLNISNNVFLGPFPGEVAAGLPDLEVLDAYNNNFTGTLPVALSGHRHLRHLSLGGSYFSGEIPEAYSRISTLEYLGLNGNSLIGRIPASLGRLSNLRELCLGYYNKYSGGIPPELGSMASLVRLSLGGCNLTGEIPASLGQLRNLDSLFLQVNNLTGGIPPELGNLTALKSLDLSNNELTGEIPEALAGLRSLTLLSLFHNHLHGRVPAFLADLPELEVLHLWGNNLTFELPQRLGMSGRLLRLDVSENRLTGVIPRGLCHGGRLEILILMENGFFGDIPEELGECNSLAHVRMGKNFLTGTIPRGLFNLPRNDMLELDDNYITGELPHELSGGELGMLVLSNNRLSGTIPPSIGNLTALHTLALQSNRIFGWIPPEIGRLEKLSKLDLSGNTFTGGIPGEISGCRALGHLDLSRNNLTGEIPEAIAGLESLATLNLSGNALRGAIPEALQRMRSLTELDLSRNDLSGEIPSGGQLLVFNESSFAGNPRLCGGPLRSPPCPDDPTSSSTRSRLASSRVFLCVMFLSAVIFPTAVIVLRYREKFAAVCLRGERRKGTTGWRMTAFQRLGFGIEDVMECLREDNVIGKGGAGTVYLGEMASGEEVAIKRLVGRGGGGGGGSDDRGFRAEIETLGRIRHRNIVRLLGYLSNREANLLLYEYMPNGSLGEKLHGGKGAHLGWEARCRIAVEAARGLCYLHHDCSPRILHRDVKSNNILLDSGFEAHVADFGLAKFVRDNGGASECMSAIAGSYGYIAPEYAYTLKVDAKSDVYSFGVVLLELITGRRPVGGFGDGVDIVRWVRKTASEAAAGVAAGQEKKEEAALMAVVDWRVPEPPAEKLGNLFRVAMLCVEERSDDRPTMRDVVHMLANAASSPPPDLLTM